MDNELAGVPLPTHCVLTVLLLLLLLLLAPRARVILPDPKLPGSDKDIVVWLDASFACSSEEEAGQRGAVAALQHVAGERSLDYVLPQVCGGSVCVCGWGGGQVNVCFNICLQASSSSRTMTVCTLWYDTCKSTQIASDGGWGLVSLACMIAWVFAALL
jgi:hypothetical protein